MIDPNTIITNAITMASTLNTAASSAVTNAMQGVSGSWVVGGDKEPVLSIDPIDAAQLDIGSAPQYNGYHFVEPTAPGSAPVLSVVPDINVGDAPVNTAVKPTYVDPQVPSPLAEFNGIAPIPQDLTVPPAPDALLNLNLTPPTLADVTVPTAPSVVLPVFDAVRPDVSLADPGDLAARFAHDYHAMAPEMTQALSGYMDAYISKINPEFHASMAALEARLQRYLAGGTALPPEAEDAIYNRGRDKVNDEYLRTRDSVYREGAQRGFTIPGGAQMNALMQARQAGADNNARLATEIVIKQAELEQNNIQFAVTQSANLRGVVLNAAQGYMGSLVQINGQAIEYARDIIQALVALYDARVKLATAQIEVYKAEAEVFGYRLKAVLAVYDLYQAQIAGIKAQVDVDVARVQAFSAQASAYGTLANAYRAIIEGVATKAQIEKIKADLFGAQVQAYSALVGAKQAEWQGFTAQVHGQEAKMNVYASEVRAYGEDVQAFQAKVQAKNVEVQAVTSKNESAARLYTAAVEAYRALVQGRSAAAEAEIRAFEGTLHAYVAEAQAKESKARVILTGQEANLRSAIELYRNETQNWIEKSKIDQAAIASRAQVAVTGAGVYANMAAAAMSGLNSLAVTAENTNL